MLKLRFAISSQCVIQTNAQVKYDTEAKAKMVLLVAISRKNWTCVCHKTCPKGVGIISPKNADALGFKENRFQVVCNVSC